ncbi:helix-turn-helix domain-containing protein [Paenibacillus alkalitolerans]|uniref:helix-turn-helix domain-containing protein n=1 Tax=Paenibacillus alkalitolerans TaxID=2799335 RepID=UPI0018F33660|nr:helix-turn-helix domain-containing protein [Paenibacillus alkalitolerans]
MSKYWMRLLLFGFFLGVIPVVAVGWFSYSIASRDIETKVIEGNSQILQQTQMRIEQVMKSVELASIQFASSSSVKRNAGARLSVTDYDQISVLSKGLSHLQTLTGVKEAWLIHLDNDWILNFRYFRLFRDLPERETFLDYGNHPKALFWTRAGEGNRSVIRMVLKIPSVPGVPPKQIMAVDIRSRDIRDQLTSSAELGSQFIITSAGEDLFGGDESPPYAGLRKEVADRVRDSARQTGFFYAEAERNKWVVIYRVSTYTDWIYASVVPFEAVTLESKRIAALTWAVCLSVAAVTAAIAYIGSRKIYVPVRRLFEFARGMDAPQHPLPYDELSLIETRLRYLSDNGKRLERQLRGQFGQLKQFFVLKLFMGQAHETDSDHRAGLYGFPGGWSRLAVMTVAIDAREGETIRERDRELLLYAVGNMVEELLPPHTRFSPIVLEQSQVTIIAADSDNAERVRRMLQETAETVRSKVYEYLKLRVSIGISKPYERLRDTAKAYDETLEALKSRYRLGCDVIVHAEDAEPQQEIGAADVFQLRRLEEQMIHAVKMGDPGRADALLEEYISSIASKESCSREYPALMVQFIAKVYQLVQEQGGSIRFALGERADIEHFMKLGSFEDIASWFRNDLFAPLFAYLERRMESRYTDIAGQMLRLIHERYDDDLSLEVCASALNFHPVYLSRVFKKEVGVGFSEYLTEYRIEMAKRWLEDTTHKISDIAGKLRYANTSAFIRTFRRSVGVTPGQYRERQQSVELNMHPDA